MIFEGLKLTALGMGVVFVFLCLLVVFISFASVLLKPLTEKEILEMEREDASSGPDKGKLVAVITAAIQAYRSNKI